MPTPAPYQPSTKDQINSYVGRNIPRWIGFVINKFFVMLFAIYKFLVQVIKDALH